MFIKNMFNTLSRQTDGASGRTDERAVKIFLILNHTKKWSFCMKTKALFFMIISCINILITLMQQIINRIPLDLFLEFCVNQL